MQALSNYRLFWNPRIGILSFVLYVLMQAGACRTLQEIPAAANLQRSPPAIKAELLLAAKPAVDDYKLRDKPGGIVRLAVHLQAPATDPDNPIFDATLLRIQSVYQRNGIKIVELSPEAILALRAGQTKAYAECKKGQVDAILLLDAVLEGHDLKISGQWTDPVHAIKQMELQLRPRLILRKLDSAHQAELYATRGRFQFLMDANALVPEISPEQERQLLSQAGRSVQGFLTVQSSAPNTSVYLTGPAGRKISLGPPPIQSRALPEGKYTVEILRKGHPHQKRNFYVRGWSKRDFFFAWSDDDRQPTLAIFSAPSGQRLALDGTVQGETPFYSSTIHPGSYTLEISHRKKPDSPYYVNGESQLEVAPGHDVRRILMTSYKSGFGNDKNLSDHFQISKEKGSLYVLDGAGLRLQSKQAPASASVGLVSQPLLINDFELTLIVEENPQQFLQFGLLGGESGQTAPAMLVQLDQEIYSLLHYQGGRLQTPQFSYRTLKRETTRHAIRFQYDHADQELSISIDGSEIHSGKIGDLFQGGTVRIAILTRASAADGRILAHELRMYTGPGLGEAE